jgi:hypothetical protein
MASQEDLTKRVDQLESAFALILRLLLEQNNRMHANEANLFRVEVEFLKDFINRNDALLKQIQDRLDKKAS